MPSRDKLNQNDNNLDFATKTFGDELLKIQKRNAELLANYELELQKKNKDTINNLDKKYRAERAAAEKKLNEQAARQTKENIDNILKAGKKAYIEANEGNGLDKNELAREYNAAQRAKLGNDLKDQAERSIQNKLGVDFANLSKGLVGALEEVAGVLSRTTDAVVNEAMSVYKNYADKVNTRLIGVGKTFKDISDQTTKFTSLYSNKAYLENVGQLVDSGIAYNVEQRAFLQTIKDDLVTTFEVNNETLKRLVRIQQQDSTAARMGMEGYLNQFLNQNYKNTEYLTDLFDSVSGSIEEATSLLTANDAVSTEYAIQKWLGALYAQGMSQSGIQAIAGALGQLGSGNINNLVGTNIGNLMAMASKGNYGNYLKDGLSEATVNLLMNSLVTYLQQLNDSGNNVVRSQLANVFGLSISDLKAAANVKVSQLGGTLSYSGATDFLGTLMDTASSRMLLAEQIENLTSNIKFAFGSQIVEDKTKYGIYAAGKAIEGILGEGNLISDIIKTGALLTSAWGLFQDLKGGAQLTGNLLATYNALGRTSISSGTGLTGGSGTSQTAYISNSNDSDMLNSSLVGIKEELKESNERKENIDENSVDVAVPGIYKYLVNVLDNKMDTIVGLTASIANYSVVDSFGTSLNMSMNTILGGTSAVVKANPVDDTVNNNIQSITENVNLIANLLQSVIANGSLNVSLNLGGTVTSNAANSLGLGGVYKPIL